MGMLLVSKLVEQVEGKVEIENTPGAVVRVEFRM